jgi:F0F1-type ATP synthase assembly protein I
MTILKNLYRKMVGKYKNTIFIPVLIIIGLLLGILIGFINTVTKNIN